MCVTTANMFWCIFPFISQCQLRKDAVYRSKNERAAEGAATKQRWEEEQRLQTEHEARVREAERARGRAVLQFNHARQSKRQEDAKQGLQEDLLLLQVALEKEQKELADEEAKRIAEKELTLQYQEQLRQQMIKEAEDDTMLEELRRQDEEKAWAKREAQHQKEKKARESLLSNVMQGRQEQVQHRQALKVQEAKDDQMHAARIREECMRLEQLDAEASMAQRRARLETQAGVDQQRKAKQDMRARQKQKEYLQAKQMKYAEKQYMKVLQTDAGQVARSANRKSTQWSS